MIDRALMSKLLGRRRVRANASGPSPGWVNEGRNFDDLDLSGLCLVGVRFERCSLRRVNFNNSDLSYASFTDCDLYRTSFQGTCLYATRIRDSDATKADFTGALLSGFRMTGTNITHSIVDKSLPLGKVRKPAAVGSVERLVASGEIRYVMLGEPIGTVRGLEENFRGILCKDFNRAILFSNDDPTEKWRRFRRREEVAKILKLVHLENGYYDRAIDYYVLERRNRRRSISWASWQAPGRVWDLISGEFLWRYGSSPVRPVAMYALSTAVFGAVLLSTSTLLPGGTGLLNQTGTRVAWDKYVDVCYWLSTAALGNNSFQAVGWGGVFFVGYNILSLLLLSLVFASTARRLSNF